MKWWISWATSGFRGGARRGWTPLHSQGFKPLPTPPPLCTTLRFPFLTNGPLNFSKGAWDAKNTNSEEVARAEKRNFLVKTFQKGSKNAFFGWFSKKLPAFQNTILMWHLKIASKYIRLKLKIIFANFKLLYGRFGWKTCLRTIKILQKI